MKPYRELFPNAGVLLPHTSEVAERVIVLPTGTAISDAAPEMIANVIRHVH